MSEEQATPTRSEMLQSYIATTGNAFGYIMNTILRVDALVGNRPENVEAATQAQLNLKLAAMWLTQLGDAAYNIIEQEDATNEDVSHK